MAQYNSADDYIRHYQNKIIPDSEKLFVRDFLFPILGSKKLDLVKPQYPFIDSEGHHRQIDFAIISDDYKIAFEINGETYHGEGIIPSNRFDDNLFRQNEILAHGWSLLRFSYTQLQSSQWRKRVSDSITRLLNVKAPKLLGDIKIRPNLIQGEVLQKLRYYRGIGWKKGLVIMPTGTGKTFLAAIDSLQTYRKKALYIVHKIDILTQTQDNFKKVWKNKKMGILTGENKYKIHNCDILFASKDSLYRSATLKKFDPYEFDYIIIDEVHHGQAPTYLPIFKYFKPKFMLGLTATPDRTDRKDILELFNYNKVCEYNINDAINNGFLVSYVYYGLTDNVDYSKIRYKNRKYNINDLEKNLIINKRNEAIYQKYLEICHGDKAIGFCVSIKHAEKMAQFFNSKGIKSVAITSKNENKDDLIKAFKKDQYAIAFTVDIFNEGIDVPNVQALLFLRPTESKTIFMQQLGRGLRTSTNKEQVRVLDFISNYKRANKIREYLSLNKKEQKKTNGAFEKYIYEYNPKCKIKFDEKVERILDEQDRENHQITKEDLIDEYYKVSEKIGKKPNKNDIKTNSKYTISNYIKIFGSWINFLREIKELTESSYHYPQGVHLGHVLYIIYIIKNGTSGTLLEDKYIHMRGKYDEGKLGNIQRQTKYKIQALMEIGLLIDDRKLKEQQSIELSPEGEKFYNILSPLRSRIDLSFKNKSGLTWEMSKPGSYFTTAIYDFLKTNSEDMLEYRRLFIKMSAIQQLLEFLYCEVRKQEINKDTLYKTFFKSPQVTDFCERHGIEPPTDESARHRVPFLLNILESMGVVKTSQNSVHINLLLIVPNLIRKDANEKIEEIKQRAINIEKNNTQGLSKNEIEFLREKFGSQFLTTNYFCKKMQTIF